MLVPEVKVYGLAVPGFVETVTDWARSKQEKVLRGRGLPGLEEFVYTGGTHRDTHAGILFNKFFGVDNYKGDVPHETGEDEDEGLVSIEKEVDLVYEEYQPRLGGISVGYVVGGDGQRVYYWASFNISVDGKVSDRYNSLRKVGSEVEAQIELVLANHFSDFSWFFGVDIRRDLPGFVVSVHIDQEVGDVECFRGFLELLSSNVLDEIEKTRSDLRGIFTFFGYFEMSKDLYRELEAVRLENFRVDEVKYRGSFGRLCLTLVDTDDGGEGANLGVPVPVNIGGSLLNGQERKELLREFYKIANKVSERLSKGELKQRVFWPEVGAGDLSFGWGAVLSPEEYDVVSGAGSKARLIMSFVIKIGQDEFVVSNTIKFIKYLDRAIDEMISTAAEMVDKILEKVR